ncbi:hypothetical protein [Sphingopyxis flava]|uniref:hypothetical protein n=1 Tax=Sphingopyxis flava TaxID=1507287 RepID=UPI0009A82FC4|nr:hypothetical protein [Sphingopyxis flava]
MAAVKISLEQMPDWPGRMTAPIAAAYMGVSHTTFLERFRAVGMKEGGSVFWARVQLDHFIADQFGVDEAPATLRSDYDRWKAEEAKKAEADALLDRVKKRLAEGGASQPKSRERR